MKNVTHQECSAGTHMKIASLEKGDGFRVTGRRGARMARDRGAGRKIVGAGERPRGDRSGTAACR